MMDYYQNCNSFEPCYPCPCGNSYPCSQPAKGPVGPQGLEGNPGPQGPAGPMGAKGATGSRGPQGEHGAISEQGPPGSAGPAGPAGATGSTGSSGAKGIPGPTGATGICPTCPGICAQYITGPVLTLNPFETASAVAVCPSGTVAIGGSGLLSDSTIEKISAPFGETGSSGWKISAFNSSVNIVNIQACAVCVSISANCAPPILGESDLFPLPVLGPPQ